MRIKNDYVSIKSGKKTFQLNNLILNNYLHTFINNIVPSEDTPSKQFFHKCFIKLNDALTFDTTSQIVMQEFDFWLENPIIAETPSTNSSTINYFFKSDNGKVYSTETFAKTDETVYRNQKITAIGFFTEDNSFAGAVLDVSNYDIYYDEGFSVARKDTIQTDAIFVSDGKIKTPKHLLFMNNDVTSRIEKIGLGFLPNKMEEEYNADEILSNYSSRYEDNQFLEFSIGNHEDVGEGLYPSDDLYPIGKFVEEIQTSEKGIQVSLEGNEEDAFVKIDGKSTQDGTPSPEFPSEIQSVGDDVNLLNKQDIINGSLSQGNILQEYNYRLLTNNPILVEPSTNYNINFKELGEFKGIRIGIHSYDSDGNFINDSGWIGFFDTMQTTYTTKNNCKYIRIVFSFSKTSNSVTTGGTEYTGNVTINDFNILKIKLQKGTVATAYSEYGKGTVEIKQSGKNLLENIAKTTTVNGITFTVNSDGTVTANGTATARTVFYIKSKFTLSEGDYIFNGCPKDGSNSTYFLETYVTTSTGKIYPKDYGSGNKFSVTEDNSLYIYIVVNSGITMENMLFKPMIRLSDINDNTYEPYFSNNYVIPLSAPLRSLPNGTKDTIEEDGIHRRVGSVVLDGSENWYGPAITSGINQYRYWLPIDEFNPSINSTGKDMLCSHYKCVSYGGFANTTDIGITKHSYQNHMYLDIFNNTIKTVNELKTLLSEKPLTVQYELAEEVVEPFTDEQQAVLNSIETQIGTNIFSVNNELNPEIQVTEYKSPIYPLDANYNYVVIKYKTYIQTIDDGLDKPYIDYYYQIVPLDKFGNLKLKIKYEKG